MVLYEGAPDYPTIERWWDIIEKYGVTIFYTSPTAIRMFKGYGEGILSNHDLSSLELLGSVGEPINPEAWLWFYRHVGGERCPVVDTWWQTETGGIMISPCPGIECVPLKPGSATLPLPGVEADVVGEDGKPVPPGQRGLLIIKKPWPGMLLGIHGAPERYKKAYWEQFPGFYYTGDYAVKDKDGYFWVLGRADEVLKVAGHRIGTAELEDAAVSHPQVAEAAVVSKDDPVKGESIVIFARLKEGVDPSPELKKDLAAHMRRVVGPIAVPDEIYFATRLCKTRSGKIMRRVLKAVANNTSTGDLTTLEDESCVEEIIKTYQELKEEKKKKKKKK
jgi:acetyl-CoA synthetase